MSGADDLRSWQIFDAKWPTEIAKMPDGHGYVNHFVADDEVDAYATVLSGFGLGYTTKAMVEGTEGLIVADTIEDLAAQCNLLVLMGGLEVNKKLQPLNAEGTPIEGLYATGNVQGGRYLVEYPVTVAGISLGTALSFGRLAGMNAAGADVEATSQN